MHERGGVPQHDIYPRFFLAYKVNIALLYRNVIEKLVVYLACYGFLKKSNVKISENENSVSSPFHMIFFISFDASFSIYQAEVCHLSLA